MNIKNYYDLFLSPELDNNQTNLRKIGLDAIEVAIDSVRPQKLIEQAIKIEDTKLIILKDVYELNKFKNIYIIGGGKAVAEMANAIVGLLEKVSNIHYKGIINIQQGVDTHHLKYCDKLKINFASHPIPDINGFNGTKSMIELIKDANDEDLILCLISGGGSSLLTLPKEKITLQDLKELNSLLLDSGASIQEINTIRKHISDFKGGNLAKAIYSSSNATLICLIISDVIRNTLDSIASGPTVPDSTTFNDAITILKKYTLFDKIPSRIKLVLEEGLKHPELENPKIGDSCFIKVSNYLIGSIENASNKVSQFLKDLSFHTRVFTTEMTGEAKKFSSNLYKIIHDEVKKYRQLGIRQNIALIGTGELTVTIKGEGIGGRNQELLLSYLNLIKPEIIDYHFLLIAANLDGIEGNSLAMGAFIDNPVLNQLNTNKINLTKYLENNDSNTFFKMIGTEIISGPTGCNVNDILIILLEV